ncbi:MAG TPA: 3'-5' exonuclease [Actinomycetota bacterium]|nr:3'-5' exonuclease [Actinomycetota bacterium]
MLGRVNVPAPPAGRARSRRWREAQYAALDFETTGLDYGKDAVVSFGVVPVRDGRVVVGEAVHRLVVPAVPASSTSMKIHHILPQDLAGASSLDDARETLGASLEGRFVLAWYAGVEMAFLRRIFGGRARAWRRRTVDVRRLAIELEHAHPDVRNTLAATAARYGVPVASPHEALDDALVAAQLFLVLASKLEARGFGSVRSLLKLTRA